MSNPANRPLEGKVALVTGASSGMGRATSLLLQEQGVNLICCDLQPNANPNGYEEDLDTSTVDLAIKRGGQAIFQQVDISNLAQVTAAFEAGISKFGRLDMLVNCAGYWAPFRLFADEDDELWAKMAAVNTLGTAKATRLAIAQFLKQEVDPVWGSRGRIVSISSSAGHIAFPGEVAYSATKAAVNHMTVAGAMDHAKDSINLNVVAPGVVHTGMARQNIESKDIHALMKKATPWPRLGTCADIANAVMFFLQPGSAWVTGQRLAVDGGMTLGVAPTL